MVSIAEVEQIVKRVIGSASASIMAFKDGIVVSDGFRALNFQGAGVAVSHDAVTRRTNVNIPGAPVATTTYVLNSTAGSGKASDLGVLGTPPSGWMNVGFSDSGWGAPVAETGPLVATALSGTTWITHTNGTLATNDIWLFRQTFTPTAGTVSGASLQICADNEILGVWFNGTSLLGDTGDMAGVFATVTISPSLILAGAANLLAVEVKNLTAAGGSNPSSLDFKLTITYSGAAVDTRYQLLSEKDAANGYAGLDSGSKVAAAELGTGTPSSSNFLRGDRSWSPASTNSVVVEEVDGSPSIAATTIQFPNGSLTNPSGSIVRYTPAGLAGPVLQLDYALASDISSTSFSSSTWTDVIANQTFTVDISTSLVEITVRGVLRVDASTVAVATSRVVIDSAGTPINRLLGGDIDGGARNNVLGGGPIYLSGLSAGSHTVKLQVFSNGTSLTYQCPTSTSPDLYGVRIQVIEHK